MLREGLIEEFTESGSEAAPTGSGPSTEALDGTTPGEFAVRGIRETYL